MESEMQNLIRAGIVSAVYPERHTARVTFEDADNVVSSELPVLVPFSQKNKSYRLPDVGESVVCVMLANSTSSGEGFIIGSYYNAQDKVKVNSQDKSRIDFSDGTFIEYDRASHQLKINCVGDIFVNGKTINLN